MSNFRRIRPRRSLAERFQRPAPVIVGAYSTAIATGTALLSLPAATESGERADLIDALFTATSAICVTGLTTVDTGSYWSTFGEVLIILLAQVGGLGIMTLATLFAIVVAGRIRLRTRLLAQAGTPALQASDVRRVLRNIVLLSVTCEAITAAFLIGRFYLAYDEPLGRAAYNGIFHAISAFNHAGFSLNSDSLTRYVQDPWITLTVAITVIVASLGYPVIFELFQSWRRPRQWSVLTRLTVGFTVILLVVGTVVIAAAEVTNPRTMGPLSGPGKLMASFFAAVTARSAGLSTIDTADLRPETILATDILMFIGGGSASVAGGIKVTTFGILAFVIWAELRGEPRVNIGNRRISESTQRQALAIALTAVGMVAVSTFFLLAATRLTLSEVLFESVSAMGTVGLSTGITGELPTAGRLLIILLMFAGRIGPLTLGSALALRERHRRYELPEERPIVG